MKHVFGLMHSGSRYLVELMVSSSDWLEHTKRMAYFIPIIRCVTKIYLTSHRFATCAISAQL